MTKFDKTLLLLRTLRYLKPRQWLFRFWYLVYKPTADTSVAPSRRPLGRWQRPPVKPDSRVEPGVFRFLNVERDYSQEILWYDAGCERLWIYNLHYFDYVQSTALLDAPDTAGKLIRQWIAENPPGSGWGWDPYPNSLRIVNWIKWAVQADEPVEWLEHSLAVQVRWLSRTVEHQILANHLFANAKALVFAGLYFSGPEADRWLVRGIALVNSELDEQVLADGAHYERSPMYHAIILEDVLDMLNLAMAAANGESDSDPDLRISSAAADDHVFVDTLKRWRSKAREMLSWYGAMVHPDGQLSFFNDAAMQIALPLEVLQAYAARLGIDTHADPRSAHLSHILEDSGYAILHNEQMRLIADVAPVGPDYQPGHTHADTLSFELCVGAERVLVNSGTSTYKMGDQRHLERSTRTHNTVEVNDANSSEVWAGFRVARRAYPQGVRFQLSDQGAYLQAAHDGYRRLKPSVMHQRTWQLNDAGLTVTDRLEGAWNKAVGRLYLHPDMRLGEKQTITTPSGAVLQWELRGAKPRTIDSLWYYEFGKSKENQCIEYVFESNEVTFALSLST